MDPPLKKHKGCHGEERTAEADYALEEVSLRLDSGAGACVPSECLCICASVYVSRARVIDQVAMQHRIEALEEAQEELNKLEDEVLSLCVCL